ncbi:unnamed protein product [Ilex paraguariensis]|uniref:Uncharacterized protein n=1 Tax=Ilex paraguariensis TaxID=185542 RepID=A0ABC8V3C4_9AQUA
MVFWPPDRAFAFARLESSCCCSFLPWMSETLWKIKSLKCNFHPSLSLCQRPRFVFADHLRMENFHPPNLINVVLSCVIDLHVYDDKSKGLFLKTFAVAD